jgi:hypothetical protein
METWLKFTPMVTQELHVRALSGKAVHSGNSMPSGPRARVGISSKLHSSLACSPPPRQSLRHPSSGRRTPWRENVFPCPPLLLRTHTPHPTARRVCPTLGRGGRLFRPTLVVPNRYVGATTCRLSARFRPSALPCRSRTGVWCRGTAPHPAHRSACRSSASSRCPTCNDPARTHR